ncbi:MAG: L-lactate permease [Tardiphaga sp.]
MMGSASGNGRDGRLDRGFEGIIVAESGCDGEAGMRASVRGDPARRGGLIPDPHLVVLVFAWVLTSFIQAIAGFGALLAVVSPILLGLGVKPLYASPRISSPFL